MDIQAVCFDLDGTLFDDRQYIQAGFRNASQLLQDRTGKDLNDELQQLFFDANVRGDTFGQLLERHNFSTGLVPELVEAYHSHNANLDPYPEVPSVLDKLNSEYKLALITGGTNGHTKINRLGIGSYFEEILVTPEHDLSKKTVEPFDRVLNALSISPDNAVFVGDNPQIDIGQPNKMGMVTIRVRRGLHANDEAEGLEVADKEIENLSCLPKLVSRLHE